MAGLLFDYFDGYLRVDFRNGRWSGDIEIIFYVSGDTTATTPCDDDFKKGEPEIAVAEDVLLRCWTSSSMSCFFAIKLYHKNVVISTKTKVLWQSIGPTNGNSSRHLC